MRALEAFTYSCQAVQVMHGNSHGMHEDDTCQRYVEAGGHQNIHRFLRTVYDLRTPVPRILSHGCVHCHTFTDSCLMSIHVLELEAVRTNRRFAGHTAHAAALFGRSRDMDLCVVPVHHCFDCLRCRFAVQVFFSRLGRCVVASTCMFCGQIAMHILLRDDLNCGMSRNPFVRVCCAPAWETCRTHP